MMASIESSCGRIGGELVCVVFPDGVEVAAALDDRGTVDLDCLHPHALGLQEEEQPFMDASSEQQLAAASSSSSSSSHFALRPLRIGRDVVRPSRSDPWAPLLPRRRYRLLLPPPPAPTSYLSGSPSLHPARRPSFDAATTAYPPPHQPHLHHLNTSAQPVVGGGGGGGGVEAQELREVKALLRSLLASGSGPSATAATATASSSSTFVDEAAASDRIPLAASFFTSAPLPSDGGAGAESASPSPATAARSLALAPPPQPVVVPTCRHACGTGESGGDAGVLSSGSGEGSKRTKRKDSKQKRMETAATEATDNGEASGEIVRVNVGGKEFITLRSTLCRFDGTFLEAVFSGRHRSVRDSMGRCFIDRHVAGSLLFASNPQHFQVILDFLRDPTMTCPELPSQKEERQAFLREVEYYGLKEVMVGEKKEAELLCEQGYAFYNGRKVSKDYRKAVELWQRAAELGEARAQNRLAMCYKNGEGVEQDLYKAIPLFQKAAEQGLRDAQYNLACIYKNGEGVGVDLTKAILWFRRAEAQGDTDARRMLETLASLASASS